VGIDALPDGLRIRKSSFTTSKEVAREPSPSPQVGTPARPLPDWVRAISAVAVSPIKFAIATAPVRGARTQYRIARSRCPEPAP